MSCNRHLPPCCSGGDTVVLTVVLQSSGQQSNQPGWRLEQAQRPHIPWFFINVKHPPRSAHLGAAILGRPSLHVCRTFSLPMKAEEPDLGEIIERSRVDSRVGSLAHLHIRAYMRTQEVLNALISWKLSSAQDNARAFVLLCCCCLILTLQAPILCINPHHDTATAVSVFYYSWRERSFFFERSPLRQSNVFFFFFFFFTHAPKRAGIKLELLVDCPYSSCLS